MSHAIAMTDRREAGVRGCRHHWIIETPHGATSKGVCKQCGAARRFPNSADGILWGSDGNSSAPWLLRQEILRPARVGSPGAGGDGESA